MGWTNLGYNTYIHGNVTMKSFYSYLKNVFLHKWRTGRQIRFCLGIATSGRREDIRKRCRRVNVVGILCTHEWNGEVRPVESVPGLGEGSKGEWWRWWIQPPYIVRTLVNVTVYLQHNGNMIKVKIKLHLVIKMRLFSVVPPFVGLSLLCMPTKFVHSACLAFSMNLGLLLF
jgi:hypothetical protein